MGADPNKASNSLLLHFDDSGSYRACFDSAGKAGFCYTSGGFSVSSVTKKIGAKSGSFLASSNSVVLTPDLPGFSFGTGDFTVEAWVNPSELGQYRRIAHFGPSWDSANSVSFMASHVAAGGKPSLWVYKYSPTTPLLVASSVLPLNTWTHVAVSRNVNTFRLFVNGVLDATATYSGSMENAATNMVAIGNVTNIASTVEGFSGFIDEVRITKGVGRYTANFTPDTTEFESSVSLEDSKVRAVYSTPRQVPGYNLEPQSPLRHLWGKGSTRYWETQTTGSGAVSGIVTIENIPGSRKVRLYRKHDGMLLRETWSAPNGAYSFSNLDPAWEYFVVAHDHLRVYNGVIQDMIQP